MMKAEEERGLFSASSGVWCMILAYFVLPMLLAGSLPEGWIPLLYLSAPLLLILWLLMQYGVCRRRGGSVADFLPALGLQKPLPAWRNWILLGLGGFAASVVMLLGWKILLAKLGMDFSKPVLPGQELIQQWRWEEPVFYVVVLAWVVLAPVTEEIFFRKVLFDFFQQYGTALFAGGMTVVVFSMMHASLVALPGLLVLAAVLQYLYCRSASLWPGIFLHMLNNVTAAALLVFAPDV